MDCKKFQSSNKTITLNMLYVPCNTEKIRYISKKNIYISKHNQLRKNQVILLMIADNKKWHCLVRKTLSALFLENSIKTCWRLLLFKMVSFI